MQTTQIGLQVLTKISPCVRTTSLFTLNDSYLCFNKLQFFLFADDTNILYVDKDLKSLEQTVNTERNNLYDWLATIKLTLNTKKSNLVIFNPRQKKISYLPQISIFDSEKNRRISLEHKSYIKCLGVSIDENLSWKNHLDCVITKISKTIVMIAKLRHLVPASVLINIYKSLILLYNFTLWNCFLG